MRATLLGPVSAHVGGVELPLGGPKQRAVFALLALHAGHVVSLDRLVDELWSDEPPARATLALQSYVSRLRRVLAEAGQGDDATPVIVTRPPGWSLTLAPDRVDATRFTSAVVRARRLLASGRTPDAAEAAALLSEALDLWAGDPLSDLASLSFARQEAARLQDQRLSAVELHLEARLALGESDTVADDARRFVSANPLRERAWRAQLVGLYRAGRQAEALAAAAQLRRALADGLGLDPSPEVRELEERILRQDPELLRGGREGAPPVLPPREPLPTGGSGSTRLVGRDDVLGVLDVTVRRAAEGQGSLLVVPAPSGLGKSSILAAIADLVLASGGTVVTGGGVGGGGMPALWPWVGIVRQLTADAPMSDHAHRTAADGPASSAVALLGGTATPASGAAGVNPGLDRTSLYRGVIDLLLRERSRRPLAVLVDDAQWVDADTLTLLSLAIDELVDRGVLFAVAYRSDEPSTADVRGMVDGVRRGLSTRVELRGLRSEEVAELIRDLSGTAPDPEVAVALRARTGGHPLFVTELVRLLTSEGRLDADGVASALPREVREVLDRRLARLPAPTVAVLTVAALAGGAADVELLRRVAGTDADAVVTACEPALLAELLVEDAVRPDTVRVSHDLVRQTIEESLPTARRVRLHAKIASALQAVGELTPQQVVDVAHHLTMAAPVIGPAAAIPYLVAASEDAVSRFANDRAEQNLRAALDLAGQVADPRERAKLERQLHGRLAIFLAYARGRVPPRPPRDDVRSGPPLDDADSAAGWLGTVITTGISGDYAGTVSLAEQALAGEVLPVVAVAAHYALGWAQFVCGRADVARREFARVEDELRRLPTDVPGVFLAVAVTAAAYSALVAHVEGDEAGADTAMAVAAARAAGSDIGCLNLALVEIWLAAMRGDVPSTRSSVATCEELSVRLEYPLYRLHARIAGAWADAVSGDARGPQSAAAAYRDLDASGVRLLQPFYLLLRAEAHALHGDVETAARLVVESRAVSADLGDVCLGPRLTALAAALVPPPPDRGRDDVTAAR